MSKCFVIMSFNEELKVVYYTIERAARNKGLACERSDSSPQSDDISDTIIKGIVDANVVVADLTYPKPNVYFELGVSYSTCRPTICISQSDQLPFDVRNYRVILYDPAHLDELRFKLEEAFDNIKRYLDNPVLQSGRDYFDLRGKIVENLDATIRDRKRAGELSDFLETGWAENSIVADALVNNIQRKWDLQQQKTILAISGAGSIGKSTFSAILKLRLVKRFSELTVDILPTDSYMLARSERLDQNITGFDIRAHDLKSFEADVKSLMAGKAVTVHPYDHGTGKHEEKEKIVYSPNILILEGIHSFHPPINKFISYSIFIYSTKFIVKELKFLADALRRGYSPATAFEHSEREYSDYEEHVFPYYKCADSVIFVDGYWRYRLGNVEGEYKEVPNSGILRTPLLRRR